MNRPVIVTAAVLAGSLLMAASSPHHASGIKKAAPVVKAEVVVVKGHKTKVLTNAKGYTVYYFTKDTPSHSACDANATCKSLWPALDAKTAPKVAGFSGKFSVVKGQLEYNGHFLYTYSGDTKPGQTKGEGLYKEWYLMTPSVKAAAEKSTKGSSGSGGGW